MNCRIIKFTILTVILLVALCGCGVDTTGSVYSTHVYVDPDTKVNYLWINSDSGITLCPRYNADGSLYVSE